MSSMIDHHLDQLIQFGLMANSLSARQVFSLMRAGRLYAEQLGYAGDDPEALAALNDCLDLARTQTQDPLLRLLRAWVLIEVKRRLLHLAS